MGLEGSNEFLDEIRQVHNVKIQLLNLGFVKAYQNSILRGRGLSTYLVEKRMKEHFVFPSRREGSRSESKAEDSVVTSRDKKDCKEECSSGVKF